MYNREFYVILILKLHFLNCYFTEWGTVFRSRFWNFDPKFDNILFKKLGLNQSNCLGLNLRVTGHCNQGGRKYMEDVFSVAYQQTEDELDLEYAFFGIYDGHGGKEAALFAKVS